MATTPSRLNLTRDQLAQFLTDHQQIKQFELLFAAVDQIAPDVVNEVKLEAGTAQATANQALAELTRLANAVEMLALAPLPQLGTISPQNADNVDITGGTITGLSDLESRLLQLNMANPGARAVGRFNWNPTDGTADFGMGFAGVFNQLGMETYFPPLYNNTGSLVEDGTVVGLTGYDIGGGGLTFVPFIADGTMNDIRALAVVTSDMEDGERGLATRTGYVRDLDTTGAPYGETWAANETIYASATIAGWLTNVAPVAPSLAFPIGMAPVIDATDGIFLVVTSDMKLPLFYGAFSDTTTQAIGAANTPQTITFNTTDASSGVSIGSPTSRVLISNNGIYNFQFSLQLTSGTGSSRVIYIWVRMNGTDIPNTATAITIKSNSDVIVPAWNFVLPMSSGDYLEMVWAADGNNVMLEADTSQVSPFVRPAIPSAILTVTQVNQ